MSRLLKVLLVSVAVLSVIAVVLFVLPLRQAHAQVSSFSFQWTAPGGDCAVGQAKTYEMRWSTVRPDTTGLGAWQTCATNRWAVGTVPAALSSWWSSANQVVASQLPVPAVAGATESATVAASFSTGVTYYFMLRATDANANISALSNLVERLIPDTTPPRPIVDLR